MPSISEDKLMSASTAPRTTAILHALYRDSAARTVSPLCLPAPNREALNCLSSAAKCVEQCSIHELALQLIITECLSLAFVLWKRRPLPRESPA